MEFTLEELKKTISGWIVDNKKSQEDRSAPWKWVTGLVIGAVALFTVAILAWQAWRKGRELAKLKHERDVRNEQIIREQKAAELAENQKVADEHLERVKNLKIEYGLLDEKIKHIAHAEEVAKGKIDAIKNWEEVDKYLDDSDRAVTEPRDPQG